MGKLHHMIVQIHILLIYIMFIVWWLFYAKWFPVAIWWLSRSERKCYCVAFVCTHRMAKWRPNAGLVWSCRFIQMSEFFRAQKYHNRNATCPSWHMKLPSTSMWVQKFVRGTNKWDIKAPYYWAWWRENSSDQWNRLTETHFSPFRRWCWPCIACTQLENKLSLS